jgi:Zn-dependent M28 family amino/carboxypeptidase
MSALEGRLRTHVEALAHAPRVPGSRQHALARAYIDDGFRSFGYETLSVPFAGGVNVHTKARGVRLVVGAHYDSVGSSPGADDNASGVAAMLEVARACREASLPVPVEFVGYDQEENGLLGSLAHCDALGPSRRDVLGMISLEMLGFTGDDQVFVPGVVTSRTRGDFLAVVSNHESAHLLAMFEDLETTLPIEIVVAAADTEAGALASLSDHGSFWDAGSPALLVTDTAFLRNPHYHRPSDLPETLDYAFLTQSTEAVIQALQRFRREGEA